MLFDLYISNIKKICYLWTVCLLMVGCSGKSGYSNKIRTKVRSNNYILRNDSYPKLADIPDLSLISEASPKYEPKSRYGNPYKYTVFNKTYRVLNSSVGYKESGYASWYGTKFHGFRTSNGDTYDMYAMTAAHKTLPLPTYAKITNLTNNRSVIVKINDRGPFHSNRIIDLSYAAAHRIGIVDQGVAKVEVMAINSPIRATSDANDANRVQKSFDSNRNVYNSLIKNKISYDINDYNSDQALQIGAFAVEENAYKLVDKLKNLLQNDEHNYKDLYQINIIKDHLQNESKKNTLYKVMISSKTGTVDLKKIKHILAKLPIQGAFIK